MSTARRPATPTFSAPATASATAMAVPSAGPFTVEVELRYQPIGYRWAHNLERYDAPEPKRFVGVLQLHVGRVLGGRCYSARGRRHIVALSHTFPLTKDRGVPGRCVRCVSPRRMR